MKHAPLRYTVARFAIFVICLGATWLLGLRHDPILLVLVAATVSMVASLFLLRGMRAQFANDLAVRAQGRVERRRAKAEQRRRDGVLDDEVAEDEEVGGAAPPRQRPASRARGSEVEADRQ